MNMRRYDPKIYRGLFRSTIGVSGLEKAGRRVETSFDKDGKQVFVLDRKEVIRAEDGVALSTGQDKLPSERK